MRIRAVLGVALTLSACFGSAGTAEDCHAPPLPVCTGTCGDLAGCDPGKSHVDTAFSCQPTAGDTGLRPTVCCMPGASDAAAEEAGELQGTCGSHVCTGGCACGPGGDGSASGTGECTCPAPGDDASTAIACGIITCIDGCECVSSIANRCACP